MDISKFLMDHWSVIAAAPEAFFTCALLSGFAGFGVARLLFGSQVDNLKSQAELNKTRLETARDDLARLERVNAEGEKSRDFLQAELSGMRADIDRMPRIKSGTGPPPHDLTDGDIYLRFDPDRSMPSVDDGTAHLFVRAPIHEFVLALEEAQRLKKPVFLVIYDSNHPTRSKLAFTLGYFLEYETTRKLVDEHFVVAVVASTDVKASGLVPANDPLERARWVILSWDGTVLHSEGLRANPDEGLEQTRNAIALADRYADARKREGL